MSDSARYVGMIKDLGKLWGHLKEGYGRLIAFYAKLVIQKINFHRKVVSAVLLLSECLYVYSVDYSLLCTTFLCVA